MSIPVGYIVTGVVITVSAIIAWLTLASEEEPQKVSSDRRSTGRQSRRNYTPPPSPFRRRKLPDRCANCDKNPYVKVHPCKHEFLCKGCAVHYLKDNDTCRICNGRIDGCSPSIPPFGKCKNCRKFTELFKFLPCNHSLSLCIHCFERQMTSYKKCPVCEQIIRGHEPMSNTSGLCTVCQEFTRFAKFKPCNHGNVCEKHAILHLKLNNQKCSECGETATM